MDFDHDPLSSEGVQDRTATVYPNGSDFYAATGTGVVRGLPPFVRPPPIEPLFQTRFRTVFGASCLSGWAL